jgi:hypothetical protein
MRQSHFVLDLMGATERGIPFRRFRRFLIPCPFRTSCRFNHHETAFTERMAMLRRQQINMQKTSMYESVLGIRKEIPLQYTLKELRTSYFKAAKLCHPDSQSPRPTVDNLSAEPAIVAEDTAEDKFILVTNAYEYLRQQLTIVSSQNSNDDDVLNETEEEQYRAACMSWLGQPAEIVEESKRCPLFRQWLFGRTDAAFYWQSFFMLHGGLAPQLRRTTPTLQLSGSHSANRSESLEAHTTTQVADGPRPRRRRPSH